MERKSTGGMKEFSYTKEDLERIRKTDTESTKTFKEAYHKWQEQKLEDRKLEKQAKKERRNLLLIVLFLLLCAIVVLILHFITKSF